MSEERQTQQSVQLILETYWTQTEAGTWQLEEIWALDEDRDEGKYPVPLKSLPISTRNNLLPLTENNYGAPNV